MLLAGRAGQHRHQFPAVLAPLVEDLFGGVRQQRHGGVFPAGRFAHAAELIGPCASVREPECWLACRGGFHTNGGRPVGWPSRLTKARLHFVTGKGGTGKSTIAASLALALAAGGRKVLFVEVEGRQGIAQLFDVPPLPYEEVKIATADGGGQVNALAIDTEAAFLEYLDMFYNLGLAGRAMRRIGAVEFATTIAPGLRDVLLTGKIREIVTRAEKGKQPVYDAVVVDSPPTGRIARFLDVTKAVSDLAKGGPVHSQAESVVKVLHSDLTAIHLVTLLEALPIQETLEAIDELKELGLPIGSVIVNRNIPAYLRR